MGKHNYNAQYNNKFQNSRPAAPVEEVAEETVEEVVEAVVEAVVEETVEAVPAVNIIPANNTTGVVDNCDKLNVRKSPTLAATPLTVISEGAEVQIDTANSTDEWYKVCTSNGVEGYCMKKFITIK